MREISCEIIHTSFFFGRDHRPGPKPNLAHGNRPVKERHLQSVAGDERGDRCSSQGGGEREGCRLLAFFVTHSEVHEYLWRFWAAVAATVFFFKAGSGEGG